MWPPLPGVARAAAQAAGAQLPPEERPAVALMEDSELQVGVQAVRQVELRVWAQAVREAELRVGVQAVREGVREGAVLEVAQKEELGACFINNDFVKRFHNSWAQLGLAKND